MTYGSLTNYRNSILFWTKRSYYERDEQFNNERRLWNELTEAMRGTFQRHGDMKQVRVTEITFVGLDELRQLLDHEIAVSPCIELSEQHQAAWCLARQTAVRPGSIGMGREDDDDALRWKDIKFYWEGEPGKYSMFINFGSVKTMVSDPERKRKSFQSVKPLQFDITPPPQENIIFSAPLRFILMGLRRGIFRDINSIDDIMTNQMRNVTVSTQDFISKSSVLVSQ